MSNAAESRLEHIEFVLLFRGSISRQDLVEAFGIGEAAATRDFRQYNASCPGNMNLNNVTKRWEIDVDSFKPCFTHRAQSVLSKLRGPKYSELLGLSLANGAPRLSLPNVDVLACVTRAIANKNAIRVRYMHASGTCKNIEIVPHSLVDNGIRWHVRAFDRSRKIFWDFVLGRISNATVILDSISQIESVDADNQWKRIVKLELAPHPSSENLKNPKAIEFEYGMESGMMIKEVRAANAGYWLRLWNVDCSPEQSKRGGQYQLCLRNPLALYDVESAVLAPGYIQKSEVKLKSGHTD
ncbi:WYL domain-containing protein [Marinobacter sp. 2_MG-2023]|uniref:WYL domain-containing protein n=1 Tax=Marinobacter sp. 2_MG-2023 TaxID=3062679 RepID=UPI0026E3F4A0|nr:WYL domain-containing protein [Marinobacter sp. 2_MG-2023]MDO6442064.1 WYL domain-containing protein [Marinobacter sp. 2_MG-2023]